MTETELTERQHAYTERIWNQGDLDAVDELLAEEFVVHGYGTDLDRETFRRYVAGVREAFPDFHVTIEDELLDDGKIAHRWTATGTHEGPINVGEVVPGEAVDVEPTGRRVEFTGIDIARHEGGRIAEVWAAPDFATLYGQIGIAESPAAD